MNERTNVAPCSRKHCVALAAAGGLCSLHAAGWSQHDGAGELVCGHCRYLVRKGDWYRQVSGVVRHAKACREHPDVAREREKATAGAP